MLLRVLFDRVRHAAIRISLAQHRVDRTAQDFRVARLHFLLRLVLRLFGIVRNAISLRLQFADRSFQLRLRGADVRQLHDIGIGGLRKLAELLQIVRLPLRRGQVFGEVRENAAGEGDVPRLYRERCGFDESLNDRQEGIGRKCRCFVSEGIDDLRVGHDDP